MFYNIPYVDVKFLFVVVDFICVHFLPSDTEM